ncbi:tRNA (adenosine(37)-N6)-threonylcarbamoyltransferase complex dimerization subunit type 1 TsaB [Histidinibacterium aquaticum]|uniref:tRNA (Adenosine(37)-N6)-threonylcarbamoyltransferase complex dimerization subunit type 1 TsaB n=1 Tax=Histidinibacterium aquaticum TaxID=2613962 RepID=A0A5J5GCP8_9RHOB|nr:tRNA (adenosine(37)-N6)-threonylcarbamoyltransferase complex dimerization subunit type 1 TsaB [Histidinibacterium aquaticum]KAA9005204.1 tRNA (adenosine(37)-N6)-threonylcarbamoyltransferase complex dimerization subunit type 1 TsaB [Histidinibacterium aquaticum]
MPPETILLGFDTSAAHCAAALRCADGSVVTRIEEMARGQGERLFPFLEALLADAGLGFRDVTAIGVGIGPGNFTGTRIAVSAARGLSLGLGVPAVGVSTFEMMRGTAPGGSVEIVSLAAPRDQVYLQRFENGRPTAPPAHSALDGPALAALGLPGGARIVGHRAEEIAALLPGAPVADPREIEDLPRTLLGIAAAKVASGETGPRPAPLYVRPADAAPPSDPPPVILAED